MIIVPDSVLVESKAARDCQLEHIFYKDAQSILARAKDFYFTVWEKIKTTAIQRIVDFYHEVGQ